MNIHIPIEALTGRAGQVLINGEQFIPEPMAEGKNMPTAFALICLLFKPVLAVLDFIITLLVWRPAGSTGVMANVSNAYMSATSKVKPVQDSAMVIDSKAVAGFVQMRSEKRTFHRTIETAGGTQVRLTFFPDEQMVERRVGVPVVNFRGKPSLNYFPVAPLLAASFGPSLLFCEQNAMLLTKRDINNGLLKEHVGLGTLPSAAPGLKTAGTSMKVKSPDVETTGDSKKTGNFASEAEGQVIKMGVVEKKPGHGNPYKTFEVVLRKMNTEEVSFNGKQLEEKAAAGAFKLGDVISLVQTKSSIEKTDATGNSFKSSLNSFEIKVIQSAV